MMLAMGWNLERISLGSLIIALGLLVDDGIIAVEMMVVKMEEGWDRREGGRLLLRGDGDAAPHRRARSPSPPSCRSASPSPSTGEYAGGIFWIVGAAVLFSWLVSGLFTPVPRGEDAAAISRKHHQGGAHADPYDTPFYRKLRRAIDFALERRWWVIGATVAALALVDTRHEARAAAVLPVEHAAGAHRRPAPEGRRLVRRDDGAGEEDGGGAREGRGRRASSPRTPAPARRASISRSTPSCPTRATRSSS